MAGLYTGPHPATHHRGYPRDDSFIAFIAAELKVPVGRLLSSNKAQNIKQVIRDRFRLWSIGVELKVSTPDKCVSCSSGFLD